MKYIKFILPIYFIFFKTALDFAAVSQELVLEKFQDIVTGNSPLITIYSPNGQHAIISCLGNMDNSGGIFSYKIDKDGSLSNIPFPNSDGLVNPGMACYSANGDFVFVPYIEFTKLSWKNRFIGKLAVYKVEPDGTLSIKQIVGYSPEQNGLIPINVSYSPSINGSHYLSVNYASIKDIGEPAGRVSIYKVDSESGNLSYVDHIDGIPKKNIIPFSATFSPNGKTIAISYLLDSITPSLEFPPTIYLKGTGSVHIYNINSSYGFIGDLISVHTDGPTPSIVRYSPNGEYAAIPYFNLNVLDKIRLIPFVEFVLDIPSDADYGKICIYKVRPDGSFFGPIATCIDGMYPTIFNFKPIENSESYTGIATYSGIIGDGNVSLYDFDLASGFPKLLAKESFRAGLNPLSAFYGPDNTIGISYYEPKSGTNSHVDILKILESQLALMVNPKCDIC